ncbi:26S proteasome non-ATPase regulatory subunit protein [Trifolium repens]|nr:26S proteasome non-ATPase regulatory subunit protein [Trifolium repens]
MSFVSASVLVRSVIVASWEIACCSPPFSCLEASSAAFFAAASCLALSSSIETLRARANSGSKFGSTPKSYPDTPPADAAAAAAAKPLPPSPSPVNIGVLP